MGNRDSPIVENPEAFGLIGTILRPGPGKGTSACRLSDVQ